MPKSPPNKSLQPTGAAIPVLRGMKVLQAAPAAELWRSGLERSHRGKPWSGNRPTINQ
jgi:hypothetical protein